MFVSSYLIGTKRPRLVSSIARRFFRSELAELHAAEKLIQQCDLDWTIIRPTQLNNAAATGKVRIQKQGLDFTSGPYQVSRADLAQVLLDTAETSVHNRKILQVTWGK